MRPCPSSEELRRAFRMQTSRAQRRSDGTFTVGGIRFVLAVARSALQVARLALADARLALAVASAETHCARLSGSFGYGSQTSPIVSLSASAWSAFASAGQLSQTSPSRSASASAWSAFAVVAQLSQTLPRPSVASRWRHRGLPGTA